MPPPSEPALFWSRRRWWGREGAWVAAALGLAGCRTAEGSAPGEPPPAPASPDAIPAGVLAGELRGAPFRVAAARYTVDRRPGYEKIELRLLGEAADTPCGEAPKGAPSVWLRRQGPEPLTAGQWRTSADGAGPWEVHYQLHDGDRWVGVGEANALFVVERVLPDLRVEGELGACFRDEARSCVAGRFTASYCRIEIDAPVRGADVMERPPGDAPEQLPPSATVTPRAAASGVTIAVDPRSELLPTYPCSRCHTGREPNPNRRPLREFHVVRNSDFSHGEDAFWCYQCHSEQNIDRLRTAAGVVLSFDEAFRICLSCHGDKQAAWEGGTHGLTLGDWDGAQRKKSCPACHDPHRPAFPKMKPLPPPTAPKGATGHG